MEDGRIVQYASDEKSEKKKKRTRYAFVYKITNNYKLPPYTVNI